MKNQELTLLYVFDAIMTEGSITRAAERLNMTQPAVSNAVSRMRHAWKDPVFVKKGRQIEPTSYALSLWDQVRGPMHELSRAVTTTGFDPATSRRKFRIALADMMLDLLWPPLVSKLERDAPGIDLHAVPYTLGGAHMQLREAHVDLAIGMLTEHDHSLRSTWLADSGYVLAMREDHPLAGRPVTLEEFLDARHLLISLSGDTHGPVDSALDRMGVSRRVAVTVNHFPAIPALLQTSDLITALPDGMMQDEQLRKGLWLTRLPIEVDPISVYLIWHARHDREPGLIWMRSLVEYLIRERWQDLVGQVD
ncbi:LysR family transcriptional regulator [Marinobacter bryozoorum]|uniref:LysR family transcriptional regulator n=1 Tax=Marinobacter bryozoorum TaxID=256324 RepID=UPI002002A1B0|nr:LysR family transcriptional regulator [Marinobacter bryozoorum]MCK7545944.1 LysR family transcriptional regulator [Marinobacter bryozoorum]